MSAQYPIRAVAKITGISTDTLRAWERRYGAVSPGRSPRGRQYGEADIDRLRRLNRLVQRGHAIGSIAGLADRELDALLAASEAPGATGAAARPDLIGPILSAVQDFDSARANDELARLAAVQAPRDFVHHTVLPLMREVGTRWHDGRLAVAQEHLVSQMLRHLLGSLLRLYRPAPQSRRIVSATPSAEHHEFGIMAASMLAAIVGIEVVYLGVDLPADEIARAADRAGAAAILCGITIGSDRTLGEVRALAGALPAATELWLGGAAAPSLDVSGLSRPVTVFEDLHAFEEHCRQWRP